MLPAVIELQSSRWLLMWLIAIHAASAIVLTVAPMPWLATTGLLALIVASFVHQTIRLRGRGFSAPDLIYIQSPQQWRLVSKSGESIITTVEHKLIFRYLAVIYLVPENGKKMVLLLPEDSMQKDQHRKLRAGLKLLP